MRADPLDFGRNLEGVIVLSLQLVEIDRAHVTVERVLRARMHHGEIVGLVFVSDAVYRHVVAFEITVQRAWRSPRQDRVQHVRVVQARRDYRRRHSRDRFRN